MVITHEKELLALMGRHVDVIDAHGDRIAWGTLYRMFDAGRVFWRVLRFNSYAIGNCTFELGDVADIAGTVVELRRAV